MQLDYSTLGSLPDDTGLKRSDVLCDLPKDEEEDVLEEDDLDAASELVDIPFLYTKHECE